MKALTLHQPYASLVALGVKRIETRSWRTQYRGRIAIHAAALDTDRFMHEHRAAWDAIPHGNPLPRGAVVATAELVDCVLMGGEHSFRSAGWDGEEQEHEHDTVLVITDGSFDRPVLCLDRPTERPCILDVSDQLPFGDFRPGRWAYLLDDVHALPTPVPCSGRQRFWNLPDDIAAEVERCRTCRECRRRRRRGEWTP